MKRIALLLTLLLVVSLIFSSCQVLWLVVEPKDADDLWGRIDKVMTDLSSSRIDATMEMKFTYEGLEVEAESNLLLVAIGNVDSEDFYYYQKSKTVMEIAGSEIETEEYLVYDEGKAYVSEKSDNKTSRIYSSLTSKEFYDYATDEATDFNITPDGAGVKGMSRYDGKKWELEFSNFEKDALDRIIEQLKLDSLEESMGIVISDVAVTITTDEKYRVDKMSIDFISESYDEPVISLDMTWSQYDSAKKVYIDKREYTEVDDVRIAKWVDNYLNEVIDRERVDFSLYMDQKVMKGSATYSSYVERDKVTYKNKNDKFTYDISAELNGQDYSIEYVWGTQTVRVLDQTHRTDQTEDEARSFIKSLMNSAQFSPSLVTNILEISNNRYRIYLQPADVSEYRQLMLNLSDTYEDCEIFIEVVLDGEEVNSIETYIKINGISYTCIIETDMVILGD